MNLNWLRASLTATVVVLLLSCGGGRRQPPVVSFQSSDWMTGVSPVIPSSGEPQETTLDEALAELEALPTPEGVDATLFGELKFALANQLRTLNAQRGTSKLVATPAEGVDAELFSDLKSAMREALVHGVGARHAVPLREEEALLDRVGRGFIPAEAETSAERSPSSSTSPRSTACPRTSSSTGDGKELGRVNYPVMRPGRA